MQWQAQDSPLTISQRMSKTQRQPLTPKQDKRQLKRQQHWKAMQPPLKTYPEPEVAPWKPLGQHPQASQHLAPQV